MDDERRTELEHRCVVAGASEYAAQKAVRALSLLPVDQQATAVLVLHDGPVHRVLGQGILPTAGDVVQFSWASSEWQLLVEMAAWGDARLLILGWQGGGVSAPEYTAVGPPLLIEGVVTPHAENTLIGESAKTAAWVEFCASCGLSERHEAIRAWEIREQLQEQIDPTLRGTERAQSYISAAAVNMALLEDAATVDRIGRLQIAAYAQITGTAYTPSTGDGDEGTTVADFLRSNWPADGPAWDSTSDRQVRSLDEFTARYGTVVPEAPRPPWWERGLTIGGRSDRWWAWVNVHGLGVRLGRVELNLYLHGAPAPCD